MAAFKQIVFVAALVVTTSTLVGRAARADWTASDLTKGFTFPDPNGGQCAVVGSNPGTGGVAIKMGNGAVQGFSGPDAVALVNKCLPQRASLEDRQEAVAALEAADQGDDAQGDSFPGGAGSNGGSGAKGNGVAL